MYCSDGDKLRHLSLLLLCSQMIVCISSQGPRGEKGNRGETVSCCYKYSFYTLFILSAYLMKIFSLNWRIFVFFLLNRDCKGRGYVCMALFSSVISSPLYITVHIWLQYTVYNFIHYVPMYFILLGISWTSWTPWTSCRFSTFIDLTKFIPGKTNMSHLSELRDSLSLLCPQGRPGVPLSFVSHIMNIQ